MACFTPWTPPTWEDGTPKSLHNDFNWDRTGANSMFAPTPSQIASKTGLAAQRAKRLEKAKRLAERNNGENFYNTPIVNPHERLE